MLSYGTQIAANYAALYPNRVRAMVLDAALEHSAPEVLLTAEAISTVENAFNRFTRWCDTAPDCALRGQDVAAVYDRLVERANRQPMPVEGALRPVTGDDIRMNTPRWLNLKDANVFGGPDLSWATLSTLIKLAVAGNAVGFAFPPQQGPTDTIFGIAANGCGDYAVDIHDLRRHAAADPAGEAAGAAPAGRLRELAAGPVRRLAGPAGQPAPAARRDRRAHPHRACHARPVHLVQERVRAGGADPRQLRAVPHRRRATPPTTPPIAPASRSIDTSSTHRRRRPRCARPDPGWSAMTALAVSSVPDGVTPSGSSVQADVAVGRRRAVERSDGASLRG